MKQINIEAETNNYNQTHSIRRNTLTFTEAWDQVFERAVSKDKLYA